MDNLPRYRIKRKIASGGMATVHLAHDEVLHRDVALKVVHPHLLERPETITRFNNEARAAASLTHDNIIKVFDYGESAGNRFIVMEYIDGLTLEELLKKHSPLPSLVLVEICSQVLAGLAVAHEQGIFHRDIKPTNVMVDRHGCVRILDFGIAHLMNQESLTITGALVGTPNYISPEQAEGKPVTGKSDVFSVGALCYECATGSPPFDAEHPPAILYRIAHEQAPSALSMNPGLLQWVSSLLDTCLSKSPEERPDVRECLELIERRCKEDGLQLERKRVAGYMNNPAQYARDEAKEIVGAYARAAREDFRRRRFVQCVRHLNQAGAVGTLPPDSARLFSAIRRRMYVRRLAVAVVVLAIVGAGVFVALPHLRPRHSARQPKAEAVPGAIENPDSTSERVGALVPDSAGTEDRAGEHSAIPAVVSPQKRSEGRTEHGRDVTTSSSVFPAPATATAVESDPGAPDTGRGRGFLYVRTNPPWARIVVDGIERGRTPTKVLIGLSAGPHELRLERKDFAVVEESVTVASSDTVSRMLRLEPLAHPLGKEAEETE